LNARAAIRVAPATAALLAHELGKDDRWAQAQIHAFRDLAAQYIVNHTG
jgi:glycerol-3-phosphate dehydrogenase